MITPKEAMDIILEPDAEKQSELVNALAEEDVKQVLSVCLRVIREEIRK